MPFFQKKNFLAAHTLLAITVFAAITKIHIYKPIAACLIT